MAHRSMECRLPRKNNKNHVTNVVNDITQDVSNVTLFAMVSEMNLVGSNPKEWWIDTTTTRHVCSNNELFISFKPINWEKIFRGNSASSVIEGQGRCC